jgi:hypothetical protein
MNTLDTRDLIEERDNLTNDILQAWNDYQEENFNGEFDSGTTLIKESDFEEYCEDFLEDCGYFPKDFPQWIKNNIDWSGLADDMRQDYSEVEFRGINYLYR